MIREIVPDGHGRLSAASTLHTIAGVRQNIAAPLVQSGEGVPALAAYIAYPAALRFDAAGNLYVGEVGAVPYGVDPSQWHPIIRRISHVGPDHIITKVAGTGTAGYSGDGGQALDAELSLPTAIAPDGGTHLFVADLSNNRIRRIEGPRPDLRVSLSVDGPLTAGASGVVHVTVQNAATDPDAYLTGPVGADVTLPTGLSFASAAVVGPSGARLAKSAGSWSCDGSGQSVSCATPDNMAPEESSTFDITVNVAMDAPDSVIVNANGSSDSDVVDEANQIAVLGISVRRSVPSPSDGSTDRGYVLAGADGGTFAFGPAVFPGSVDVAGDRVVAGAPAGAHGSWLTTADGSVFTTGDAQFFGSLGSTRLNSPIVGIAAHGSGWLLVGRRGRWRVRGGFRGLRGFVGCAAVELADRGDDGDAVG